MTYEDKLKNLSSNFKQPDSKESASRQEGDMEKNASPYPLQRRGLRTV